MVLAQAEKLGLIGASKLRSLGTLRDSQVVFSASGGSEVKEVGGYKYHLFTATSTFTVSGGTKICEIAVIGAGGGGGIYGGGGGGGAKEPASGYTNQLLSTGTYSVTIASAGAGATARASNGGTPSATSFAGITTISALGGGGGSSDNAAAGSNGGSGGGGSYAYITGGTASGSNTNAGGLGQNSAPNYPGGGGGGATAAGVGGSSGNKGGNGGEGLLLTTIDANLTSGNFTTFSGMTRVCSGGGGNSQGGTAGTGGTGAGNGSTSGGGASATSFGSGGGGSGGLATAGSGYGGLVIVRYAL